MEIIGTAELKEVKSRKCLEIQYVIKAGSYEERQALELLFVNQDLDRGALYLKEDGLHLWGVVPIPDPKVGAAHA